jgi:hypothetical protein
MPPGIVMTQFYHEPWFIAICQDAEGKVLSVLTEKVPHDELFIQ